MDYLIPILGLVIIGSAFWIAMKTRENSRRKKFDVEPPF
jgi:LPXTG-motif cell wall-anchored protein